MNNMDIHMHFLYGAISGASGIIVSQPFFIIKSFIQNKEGNFNDIKQQYKKRSLYNNIKWFYSGYKSMIIGAGAEKMLVFGTYNGLSKFYNIQKNDYYKICLASYFAGIVASFASTPAEQIANDRRLQVLKQNYSLNHLYQGLGYTMIREKIGFSVYITTFEYLQNEYNKNNLLKQTALNGSITCIASWIIVCPIDTLKTLKQSNKNIVFNDIFSGYRGFKFALMRALPFHTTCLFTYNYLRNLK